MKLYFAAGESYKSVLNRVRAQRRLVSYYHLQSKVKSGSKELYPNYSGPLDIFIDSGAYSAYNSGQEIDIQAYTSFLRKVAVSNDDVGLYANLDVIGDHEASQRNLAYMEEQGLAPVPVFHVGEPLGVLRELLEEDYEVIALGGMVGTGGNRLRKFLDACFSKIKKYWPCKIHSFGRFGEYLKDYPFWSADATSWTLASNVGTIYKFNPATGTCPQGRSLLRGDRTKRGVRAERLSKQEMNAVNLVELMEFERYLTRLWANRGIGWNDHEPQLDKIEHSDGTRIG